MRPSERQPSQMRDIHLETGINKHAEGSCLSRFGDTHVICTASVETRVPGWMRDSGKGWVTAEYGMLPRSTGTRTDREAARGKQGGRTLEIQRLIGRSLRAVTDLTAMPDIQVRVDCDVIQADGGTRTASITGGYVALHLAFKHILDLGLIKTMPLIGQVAAISCGVYKGIPVLDLDYDEDSTAEVDANFVLTRDGGMVEIQGTAEDKPFPESDLHAMLELAKKGVGELCIVQSAAIDAATS